MEGVEKTAENVLPDDDTKFGVLMIGAPGTGKTLAFLIPALDRIINSPAAAVSTALVTPRVALASGRSWIVL